MKKVPLLWKVVFAASLAGALACISAWFLLLFDICSNPRQPEAATQHTIPYGCHGTTVYLTPFQQAQLEWLGPVGLLFILLVIVSFAIAAHKAHP
jgi:hypothetical protein